MNTRKLLVSVLMLVCVSLSACAPAATPTPIMITATSSSDPTITPTATAVPNYVEGVGQILFSLSASAFPQTIPVGPDTLWYWSEDCYCVVRIDPTSGKEVASIQVGQGGSDPYGNPKDMVVHGKTVWTTDAGHFAVVRIDPDTNQIVETIPLEFTDASGKTVKINPMGLALDGTTLWVSDFDRNYVVRVDTETKKIVAAIPDIRNPVGIAVSPGAVWVVEHRSDQIVRIDPATNKVIATILIPPSANAAPTGSCGMCIDSVIATKDAVWVAMDRGYGVARIDPQTNTVSAVIPLEFPVRNIAIGDNVVWAAGSVYGNCEKTPAGVARIDPQTNTLIGTIPLPCAYSVAISGDIVWVGSGITSYSGGPTSLQLTAIKPAQ